MSWILDIVILVILGITIFVSYKKGFVKTVLSAGSFLLAIIVTALFAQPLAGLLRETPVADSIRVATEEKIIAIIEENSYDLDDLFDGKSKEFNRLTRIAGVSDESLAKWKEEQQTAKDAAIAKLAQWISTPVINAASSIISVIVLFLSVQILLTVGKSFLEKLSELPVLHACDKTLGVVLGVILGLFRVLLFCFIAHIILSIGNFVDNGFLSAFNPDKTILFNLISKIKLFSFFI